METGFLLTCREKEKAEVALQAVTGAWKAGVPVASIQLGKCRDWFIDELGVIEPYWIAVICDERGMDAVDTWMCSFAGIADDLYGGSSRIVEFITYAEILKKYVPSRGKMVEAKPVAIEWVD
jgi:hypothetical protein